MITIAAAAARALVTYRGKPVATLAGVRLTPKLRIGCLALFDRAEPERVAALVFVLDGKAVFKCPVQPDSNASWLYVPCWLADSVCVWRCVAVCGGVWMCDCVWLYGCVAVWWCGCACVSVAVERRAYCTLGVFHHACRRNPCVAVVQASSWRRARKWRCCGMPSHLPTSTMWTPAPRRGPTSVSGVNWRCAALHVPQWTPSCTPLRLWCVTQPCAGPWGLPRLV